MKPEIGNQAPTFSARAVGGAYGDGAEVNSSELAGKPIVLVFYPRDNTPGCTKQACAMRDNWSQLDGLAHVFGISADDELSHKKFIEKQSLPYPLLVDVEREIIDAYAVWKEKSMYGKKFWGIERSTFIIDADGKLTHEFRKVSPAKHLDLILEALK
ncbi:peroxiredoxin [Persicirhabdus sediminis]|uniref:thioredoxin-dependent peroxiredoxin n=1 Tax=Persicirhabdus sediminis TaxID=454144 RepID=A0A8J7SIC6_9BACT|nr:peroxiredoxin [Persicirhabdus sediminis]MBK1791370.1 peroxiredoxin [Persicirhabdus sediminis]